MRVDIEMPLRVYDGLLDKCDQSSREYTILKNGVIVHHDNAGDTIEFLCDIEEANNLLILAGNLDSVAVLHIAKAITAALKSDKKT